MSRLLVCVCISWAVINAFLAAGECRRQVKNVTNLVKNVNILEFGYNIWNPYEKYIQKSPNMPGIGSLIREIDVKIVTNWIKANKLLLSKTSSRVLSVNMVNVSMKQNKDNYFLT